MSRSEGNILGSVSDNPKKHNSDNEYTDSGFLSSGNMIVSGEIPDDIEDIDDEVPRKTEYKPNILQDKIEEVDAMYVDSGMCLSEDLSHLNLEENPTPKVHETSRPESDRETCKEKAWLSLYQQDEDGDTELHLAISNNVLDVAAALIQMVPHPRLLDTANDDALTPLHIACSMRLSSIVRLLIVAGAKPGPRDSRGDSPLHLASRLGDTDCCRAILYPVQSQEREQLGLRYPAHLYSNFDLEQWNYEGKTCVHVAAQYGHIEILRHLVWFGADINAREGTAGLTALHYAVRRKDMNLLNFLLNECEKIDLRKTNYGGVSAFKLSRDDNLTEMFHQKGVKESPYCSEDEYMSDSEDDEDSLDSGSSANIAPQER